MFLITPSVVRDEALWAIGDAAALYATDVRVGARQGLLPFSRERQTGNYNNRAMEAFNAGDLDKAIHYINNSLRLHTNQPEMVKFRQRILGVKEQLHERSLMERVFRSELGGLSPVVHAVETGEDFAGTHQAAFFDSTIGAQPTADLPTPGPETTAQVPDDSDPSTAQTVIDDEAQTVTAAHEDTPSISQSTSETAPPESATTFEDPEVPDQAGVFRTEDPFGFEFTDEERDRFVDRFIYEYFTALGLAYLSPCEPWTDVEDETFVYEGLDDEPDTELAEADADASPVD